MGRMALGLLLAGSFGISLAYGLLLLLPLYVRELGGDEADFGLIASAGTLTAALAIGALIRFPDRLRPSAVLALAVSSYGLGAAGVAAAAGVGPTLLALGVLLGTAWAVVYAAGPMAMSELVTDDARALYFGYLTGAQQLGIGLGPVLGRWLLGTGSGYRGVFLGATALCAAAATALLLGGRLVPDPRARSRNSVSASQPLLPAVRRILGSEAGYSLLMVPLFACLFTAMTSFQTTFAQARGLDYSVYYVGYTAAVIFSRFVLSRAVVGRDPYLVIAVSVTGAGLAVASFLLVGSNSLVYGLSAVALGVGYGVALPSIQAQAVNVSEDGLRPRVLPIAGLVFETAILAFPLAAGRIITGAGYQALFAVLVAFAVAQAGLGWWRLLAARRRVAAVGVQATLPD
jgi:MFS family permease